MNRARAIAVKARFFLKDPAADLYSVAARMDMEPHELDRILWRGMAGVAEKTHAAAESAQWKEPVPVVCRADSVLRRFSFENRS